VGKGSEVSALEKLKMPIYFDKYGTPIENQFSKDMPAGVTISVLDNYIVARWRKAVKAVKQSMVGSTVIPQAPSPLTLKDAKGK
jgi:hypothetical protein